jgi:hypothetical protein
VSLDLDAIRARTGSRIRFSGPDDASAMLDALDRVLALCEQAEVRDAEVVRQTALAPLALLTVADVRRALRGETR